MATVADAPRRRTPISNPPQSASLKAGFSVPFDLTHKLIRPAVPAHIKTPSVLVTQYSFPTLEPLQFHNYPTTHLHLPLRRDLVHRAIVYEGDKHRQGTASTKWRSEVHGSGRKLRPQKGTGRARLGDKKSPMLRGGGVAFGPKPRDFATGLNKKIYDLAWRTALSYRYRKGELVVVDRVAVSSRQVAAARLPGREWTKNHMSRMKINHYVRHVFETLRWGRINKGSFVVTLNPSENVELALQEWIGMGRLRTVDEVDVKNLLEMGRLVVEKEALDYLLFKHQSDLVKPPVVAKGVAIPASLISKEVSTAQQMILNERASMEQLEEALAAESAAEAALTDESQWEDTEEAQFEEGEVSNLRDCDELKEKDEVNVSTR